MNSGNDAASRPLQSGLPARPKDRTAFHQMVYRIVRAIPPGRVMTYGAIGALIPTPQSVDPMGFERIRARWVGYALADCSDDLPWHRVVNAAGRISQRHGLGPRLQRELLSQEGIELDRLDRVDLASLLWRPSASWLKQHGLLT